MTRKRDQHVAQSSDGKWAVRSTGAERASKKFESSAQAVMHAQTIAKQSHTSVYIHGADGQVVSKNSYAPGATLFGKGTMVTGGVKPPQFNGKN